MPNEQSTSPLAGTGSALKNTDSLRRHLAIFVIFTGALCAVFFQPLASLAQFSYHSDFFSYIPLIPIISIYLVWIKKDELPRPTAGFSVAAALTALAGIGLAAGWAATSRHVAQADPENYLTANIAAFTLLLAAGCLAIFGRTFSRAIAFPIVFLVFMIPMPSEILHRVEYFLQVTSSVAASAMLKTAGMTMFRDGIDLHLPGFDITVAPECSGIHSTMVLLIVSTLAAYLFLTTGWKRAVLVAFILPLAILRNGFRVFVISELCVQVSHDMINSYIHRKGGPIFFALSLIPFLGLLWYLKKSEPAAPGIVDTQRKA
jgi:exosortase C (VPDSG-CTERM-specific)